MESSRQTSDLKLDRKECPKCGAVWLNGQHIWTGTGKPGNDLDLAGLVCNNLSKEDPDYTKCINPCRGQTGGQTWEYRRGYVDGQLDAMMPKSGIPDKEG